MKLIKRFFILFFIGIVSFLNESNAQTNIIDNLKIDMNIKGNNIEITEIWKGKFAIGTELYKSFNNMNSSDIFDFCVIENGRKFENLDKWMIDNSRVQKKNKASIYETIDGIEMCFGIGEKGYHEYKIKYTLNNAFFNNEMNLKLLENNIYDINKLDLTIKGDFDKKVISNLNSENGKYVEKGKIVYNIDYPNNSLELYLNYDGIKEKIDNNKIIILKSNDKKFSNFKKLIAFLLMICTLIIFLIIRINQRKEKIVFKAF